MIDYLTSEITSDEREIRIKQIEEELEGLESEKSRLLQELLEIDQV